MAQTSQEFAVMNSPIQQLSAEVTQMRAQPLAAQPQQHAPIRASSSARAMPTYGHTPQYSSFH